MPQKQSYLEINLTKGQVAYVSQGDYERLSSLKWSALWNKCTKNFYAVHLTWIPEEKTTHTVYMHRLILGLKRGDKRQGDHIDRNTLNNTRDNLRIATQQQNSINAKLRTDNTSGFKGAYFDRAAGKWLAIARINGRNKFLGYFPSAEKAGEKNAEFVSNIHGEFFRPS